MRLKNANTRLKKAIRKEVSAKNRRTLLNIVPIGTATLPISLNISENMIAIIILTNGPATAVMPMSLFRVLYEKLFGFIGTGLAKPNAKPPFVANSNRIGRIIVPKISI